jgi:hypothetical protein
VRRNPLVDHLESTTPINDQDSLNNAISAHSFIGSPSLVQQAVLFAEAAALRYRQSKA